MSSGLGSKRPGPATPMTPTSVLVAVFTAEIVFSNRLST
jgi:hypothetical protein